MMGAAFSLSTPFQLTENKMNNSLPLLIPLISTIYLSSVYITLWLCQPQYFKNLLNLARKNYLLIRGVNK